VETSGFNFGHSSRLIKYSLTLEKCKLLQFICDRPYNVSETEAMKGVYLILISILIILGVPHFELSHIVHVVSHRQAETSLV